ncbi:MULTISPECIES: acyltransferase [unclassified Sphingomonas]|jgi:acyltransferase|uniref:acyltransferase family protein n=1 Tax=unclassified Sphingomonas TaxID=196159 RepID=UPI0025E36D14|nr:MULTISPECIES: acyltransferase [unclassified Sphingomonas]
MRSGTAGHRSTGIDGVRGLLVLGVILGHFFEITEGESFPAWIGAGLRMPLFIGLTGYLFNLERARGDSITALLRRYYPRLILPWIVASLVHVTLTRELHIGTPLSLLLWPPFHLWFVPVMMAFILIAAVSRWTPPAMLGLAIPVSIGAMYLLGVGHLPPALHHWMPDRRFFIYPVYFFYGLLVAQREPDRVRQGAAVILAPIGFLWWCSLYDQPNVAAEVAAELIACLPLIYLLPVVRGLPIPLPGIAAIGRNSLFYYLWHPLIFALWHADHVRGLALFALTLATLVALVPLLAHHASLARILGIVRPRSSGPSLSFDSPNREPVV